ncbi:MULTISPECIES: AAA family ATPase [Streptomyces]|uniref:Phosphotransferase n=2 Tax=Streptomyces TaxID=1883 RepID=A0A100Y9S8_9ACTN|nr:MULTISPECIES: AAA family ATPase [Streptomyces]KUH40287.1 phosphotransferase [Streptomyces kanasensis]UUS34282.1 AAA family ATPase [Streptomyces changanensis]
MTGNTGPTPVPGGEAPGVIVVSGISAAGKSTVAQGLAERLPRSVHLRGDVFRRMIVSGRADMTAEVPPEAVAQLRLRHRLAAASADAYVEAGFTVVLQDVLLGEHPVEITRTIRSRPLAVVVLAPDPEVVARREEQRSKTGYGPDWQPQDLDRILRVDTPPIGLWLDTSHQSVDRTVDEILRRAWSEGAVS